MFMKIAVEAAYLAHTVDDGSWKGEMDFNHSLNNVARTRLVSPLTQQTSARYGRGESD